MHWWRGKPWVSKVRESPKDPGNPGQESLWVNRICEARDRVGLSQGQKQREDNPAALLPSRGLLRIHLCGGREDQGPASGWSSEPSRSSNGDTGFPGHSENTPPCPPPASSSSTWVLVVLSVLL